MAPMSKAVCLCARSSNQNKALTGATIFMQGGLRLCWPARPGTFLVTLNHCLFTLSQELNELRLRAHPGKLRRPHPTLPPPPPPQLSIPYSLPQQQPPPPHVVYSHKHSFSSNISQIHGRVFFSLLLIFGRYRGLCGYITPTTRHYQLFSGGPVDWFCQQLWICSSMAE